MNYTEVKLVRDHENPGVHIKTAGEAAALVSDIQDCTKEKFVVIALDSRLKVTAIQVVSVGTANASLVGPREIFQVPILTNAISIVLAHNHPSGDPSPSEADIGVTRRLQECGELLDIEVNDHIIIGANGKYFSFRDENLLADKTALNYGLGKGL